VVEKERYYALTNEGGEHMHLISLFELLLVVFAFFAAMKFEGTMRLAVILLSLLTIFLFEKLDKRIQEDEVVRERLHRYKIDGRKKKAQADESQPRLLKEVEGGQKL
jgi:hypothetical protein